MNKSELQKRLLLMMNYDLSKTSIENLTEQNTVINNKFQELPSDKTQVSIKPTEYFKGGEVNPYNVEKMGGGKQEFDAPDIHELYTWFAIGTYFIPYIGPFLSTGFQLLNAQAYYDEKKYYEAGMEIAFSLIPIDEILKTLKLTKPYSSELIKNVLKKIGRKTSKFTKEEIEVLKDFKQNWDPNTLKDFKVVFRKWYLRTMFPEVVRKSIIKLSSRKIYMFLFNLKLHHPKSWSLLKGVVKIGGIWITADQLLKMIGINPKTGKENYNLKNSDKENLIEFTNVIFDGLPKESRDSLALDWLETYKNIDTEQISESYKIISEATVRPLLQNTDDFLRHFLSKIAQGRQMVGPVFRELIEKYGKSSISELDNATINAISKGERQGFDALTVRETSLILESLNPKKLAKELFDEHTFFDQDIIDDIIDNVINKLIKNPKNGIKEIEYVRKNINDNFFQTHPEGIPENLKPIYNEWSDQFFKKVENELRKKDLSLANKVFGTTSSKTLSNEELRSMFNPEKWLSGQLNLTETELRLLVNNFRTNSMWKSFLNIFKTDLDEIFSKILRIQKILKALEDPKLNTELKQKGYNIYVREMNNLYLNHRKLFQHMRTWMDDATKNASPEVKDLITKMVETSDDFKTANTIFSSLNETNPTLTIIKTAWNSAIKSEKNVLSQVGQFISRPVTKVVKNFKTWWNNVIGQKIEDNVGKEALKELKNSVPENELGNWLRSGSPRGNPWKIDNRKNYIDLIERSGLPAAKKSYLMEILFRIIKWKIYLSFLKSLAGLAGFAAYNSEISACNKQIKDLRNKILNDPNLKNKYYTNGDFKFGDKDVEMLEKNISACDKSGFFSVYFFNRGFEWYKGENEDYTILKRWAEYFLNSILKWGGMENVVGEILYLFPGWYEDIIYFVVTQFFKDAGKSKFYQDKINSINRAMTNAENELNKLDQEFDTKSNESSVDGSPKPQPTSTTQPKSSTTQPTQPTQSKKSKRSDSK